MQESLGDYSHLEKELVFHASLISTEIPLKLIFKNVLSNIFALSFVS